MFVWWVCWLGREQCDEIFAGVGCVGGGGGNVMKYVPGVGLLVGESKL